MTETWDIPSAIALYNIDRWGTGYFTINAAGNVQVMPTQTYGNAIDLMEVVTEARKQGMAFPLVIRFQDLLRHRVETINRAFHSAIGEANYQNTYKGVFPIKVNQLREVVEEIMDAGRPFNFGLEAGSKPELIAALAVHRDPEGLIICNGYKDSTFIQNALLGRKLGKQVIMVVEKMEEVRQIIQVSRLRDPANGRPVAGKMRNSVYRRPILWLPATISKARVWPIRLCWFIFMSAHRFPILESSSELLGKQRDFMPSSPRWGIRCNSLMSGAAWVWIMTGRELHMRV